MKKYILALTAFAIGMLASAQGIYQFTDPSFETWSGNNTPGNEWRSFESAVDNGLGNFFFGIGKSASPKPSKV